MKSVFKIAEKDLKIEFRRTYELLSILTFSISSVLLSSFSWRGGLTVNSEFISVTVWIIFFFTGILGLTTTFIREVDKGTLGGLKTLPCSPLAILAGKTIYAFILLFTVEIILTPFLIVFLNLSTSKTLIHLLLTFLLGTFNLSIVGSFVSSFVIYSEGKTLLCSLLLFPVCTPILILSASVTNKILQGLGYLDFLPELKLLTAFLLMITLISSLTFKLILQE